MLYFYLSSTYQHASLSYIYVFNTSQWFLTSGLQTSSISSTWNLLKMHIFLPSLDPLNQKLGWDPGICVLRGSSISGTHQGKRTYDLHFQSPLSNTKLCNLCCTCYYWVCNKHFICYIKLIWDMDWIDLPVLSCDSIWGRGVNSIINIVLVEKMSFHTGEIITRCNREQF